MTPNGDPDRIAYLIATAEARMAAIYAEYASAIAPYLPAVRQ